MKTGKNRENTPQRELRARLGQEEILVAPGVYDAFGAMMAARADFEALYVSGASIAYTKLGRPDIGLVTADEVAAVVGTIRERVALPLIVDADTGFGNALNVQRTVKLFERNGASAIQLEDQSLPKRCGHLAGKTLVSAGEMEGKIKAALDARQDDDTLIVARTDAIAVEGYECALERAAGYVEAGADVLFIEALQDKKQIAGAIDRFGRGVPQLVNMVEGGKTPLLPSRDLGELGFSIVIYPGALVRALACAASAFFGHLREHGSTSDFQDKMLDFTALNDLLGTEAMLELGGKYAHGDK